MSWAKQWGYHKEYGIYIWKYLRSLVIKTSFLYLLSENHLWNQKRLRYFSREWAQRKKWTDNVPLDIPLDIFWRVYRRGRSTFDVGHINQSVNHNGHCHPSVVFVFSSSTKVQPYYKKLRIHKKIERYIYHNIITCNRITYKLHIERIYIYSNIWI